MVTYNGITFNTVLNSEDDLGLTSGASELNGPDVIGTIEANYASDTLIEFEPGHYTIETTWYDFDQVIDSFGIRGLGTSRRDVVWDVPDTSLNNIVGLKLSNQDGGQKTNHLFRNFSINVTTNGDRHYRMQFESHGGFHMQDIEWLGTYPIPAVADYDSEQPFLQLAAVTDDAVVTTRRLVAGVADPQPYEPTYSGAGGEGHGPLVLNHTGSHAGECVIEDWWVEDLPNEAMRLSNAADAGVHTIRGGRYRNNQKTNIRTAAGNHASKVTTVHNATVIQAGDGPVTDPGSGQGTQPINIDNSDNNHYGLIFRNMHLYVDSPQRSPVIDIPSFGDHGEVTFENCHVENATDLTTLSAADVSFEPDEIYINGGHWLETGAGGGLDISNRAGSEINDACVDVSSIDADFAQTNVSTSGCEGATVNGFGSVGRTEAGVAETTAGVARCR